MAARVHSLLVLALLGACSPPEEARKDAGPAAKPELPPVVIDGDPLELIAPFVVGERAPEKVEPEQPKPVRSAKRTPRKAGHCAQIRAFDSLPEAREMGLAIAARGLPVALLKKDLGARGTWFRVCVGDEPTKARLQRAAKKWVAGPVAPFLDPGIKKGEPVFWPKTRSAADELEPPVEATEPPITKPAVGDLGLSDAQARALLGEQPDATRKVYVLHGRSNLGAVVARAGAGLVFVDDKGARLKLDETFDCARCGSAQVRVPLLAADVAGNEGEELVVSATSAEGDRWLEVYGRTEQGAEVVAGIFIARDSAALRTDASVAAADADGDGRLDLVVTRRELQIAEDRLCDLREEGRIFRIKDGAVEELSSAFASAMAAATDTGGGEAALALIRAFDELGDADAASESCASFLAAANSAEVARACIGRVKSLRASGRLVDAVNAAGALTAAAASLRSAVAGPFFSAAEALDKDPRLGAQAIDCVRTPLARRASARSIDQIVRVAHARLSERLSLGDVNTQVYVTGARDFGPNTPVGRITARWLERLEVAQPARHAAIAAALAGGALRGRSGETGAP